MAVVLSRATERLRAVGVDSPRLDAELLLGHVLGKSRTYLAAHGPDTLQEFEIEAFEAMLDPRLRRVPLPYILHRWEFRGLEFEVGPDVLIPRPETELLVEALLDRAPLSGRVLDIGTGSGCVAIGAAYARPDLALIALERDSGAARVAERNVLRHRLTDRVRVFHGSFPEDLTHALDGGTVDVVVSNPPYIPSAELPALQIEVRAYEPALALDGGPDGLRFYRAFAELLPACLGPDGAALMEVGTGQASEVTVLLAERGWRCLDVLRDLAGVERVVAARRPR